MGEEQALLRTGVIVPVRIVGEAVVFGVDEGEFVLRLTLSFDDEDSPEEDHAGCERCATFEVQVRDFCATFRGFDATP